MHQHTGLRFTLIFDRRTHVLTLSRSCSPSRLHSRTRFARVLVRLHQSSSYISTTEAVSSTPRLACAWGAFESSKIRTYVRHQIQIYVGKGGTKGAFSGHLGIRETVRYTVGGNGMCVCVVIVGEGIESVDQLLSLRPRGRARRRRDAAARRRPCRCRPRTTTRRTPSARPRARRACAPRSSAASCRSPGR